MTREDAYYERIKLLCGDWASYDKWLNSYLETENPLSDIILTLIDCGDDMKEVEYRLHLYCLENPFDEESVYTRLRVELCDRYEKNEMTTDEVMSALYHFSQVMPFCTFFPIVVPAYQIIIALLKKGLLIQKSLKRF